MITESSRIDFLVNKYIDTDNLNQKLTDEELFALIVADPETKLKTDTDIDGAGGIPGGAAGRGPGQAEGAGGADLLGQPGLGVVQGEHPVFRVSGRGDGDDVLLSLAADHEAHDLRVAEQRVQFHGVHGPAVLERGVWCDQLSGGTSAV